MWKRLIVLALVALSPEVSGQKFVKLSETVTGVAHFTYGKVRIVQGNETSYSLTGKGNSTDAVSLSVKNNILSVERKWFSSLAAGDSVVIILTLRDVSFLSVSGPGIIEVSDGISGKVISIGNNGSGKLVVRELAYNNVDVSLSGRGIITIRKLLASTLHTRINGSGQLNVQGSISSFSEVRLSGSGKVTFSGNAPLLTCLINGSGELNAQGYLTKRTNINVSGSGNARINTEILGAKISGSGNVYYVGSPALDLSKSGNGKLVKLR